MILVYKGEQSSCRPVIIVKHSIEVDILSITLSHNNKVIKAALSRFEFQTLIRHINLFIIDLIETGKRTT